jgi:hypothetical protein
LEKRVNIIILAKFKAVKNGELRLIRNKNGIFRIYVITGKSYVLIVKNLGTSRCGKIL